LNGPRGRGNLLIVMGRRLGGKTRAAMVSRWGPRRSRWGPRRCKKNSLKTTG